MKIILERLTAFVEFADHHVARFPQAGGRAHFGSSSRSRNRCRCSSGRKRLIISVTVVVCSDLQIIGRGNVKIVTPALGCFNKTGTKV